MIREYDDDHPTFRHIPDEHCRPDQKAHEYRHQLPSVSIANNGQLDEQPDGLFIHLNGNTQRLGPLTDCGGDAGQPAAASTPPAWRGFRTPLRPHRKHRKATPPARRISLEYALQAGENQEELTESQAFSTHHPHGRFGWTALAGMMTSNKAAASANSARRGARNNPLHMVERVTIVSNLGFLPPLSGALLP